MELIVHQMQSPFCLAGICYNFDHLPTMEWIIARDVGICQHCF